jgi:hypothetical protein
VEFEFWLVEVLLEAFRSFDLLARVIFTTRYFAHVAFVQHS